MEKEWVELIRSADGQRLHNREVRLNRFGQSGQIVAAEESS
jgi:hypothetical protein